MISILVPYAPAGPDRDAAWVWNEQRLRRLLPEAELVVAAPDLVGDPARFSRSLALNRAAAKASGNVLLIVDADTTYECPASFRDVELIAEAGGWSLPERYIRLSREASRRWKLAGPLAGATGEEVSWASGDIDEEFDYANSGVVCLPRSAFDEVGGFDERFISWGGEDDAMRHALETLWGPPTRAGTALHLYHPRPPEHSIKSPDRPATFALVQRYEAASGDPEAMRALIEEER